MLSAVIIAGLASLAVVGNYTYFGVSDAAAHDLRDWVLVVACGVVGGAFGAAFSLASIKITRRIRRMRTRDPRGRAIAVAAVAGLIVAIVGIATAGATFGTGYDQARSAIEGETLSPLFFAGKFVASLASTLAGIPAACLRRHCPSARVSAAPSGGRSGATKKPCRNSRHGRLFRRRGASSDDGLCHHPRNDRQSRQPHPADAARLWRVAADLARASIPCPVASVHRRRIEAAEGRGAAGGAFRTAG